MLLYREMAESAGGGGNLTCDSQSCGITTPSWYANYFAKHLLRDFVDTGNLSDTG